jgi:flagellar biosynthesis protein FlhG
MSIAYNAHRKHELPNLAQSQVWAFGGGKGGIGKSFLTTNIAICLTQLGYTVTLVDLDVGGANLHTCIGESPKLGLADYFQNRVTGLKELMTESKIPRLKYIGGVSDTFSPTSINEENKFKLLEEIPTIESQLIFVDLGAGTNDFNSDFFNLANQSIIVTTPEPTSIENTYQYVRAAIYRKLKLVEVRLGAQELFARTLENRLQLGIRTPADFLKYLYKVDSVVGPAVREEIEKLKLRLILNQIRTKTDIELGHSVKLVCRQYFGVNVEFAGFLEFDNAAWQSTRKKQPLVLTFPYSHLSGNLFNIAKSLVEQKQNSAIL